MKLGKIAYVPLLLGLLLFFAVGVSAQFDYQFTTAQPSWYFRIGGAWPSGDTVNSVEPIFGIGHEWPIYLDSNAGPSVYNDSLGSRTMVGISIDYIPIESEIYQISEGPLGEVIAVPTGDTRTVSVVPMLAYYKAIGLVAGYRGWAALGIGGSWVSDDIYEMDLNDGFNFSWMVGVGLDFTPQLFFDSRFIAGTNAGDDGIVAVELGYRF